MTENFTKELADYGKILEKHFHDMVDIDFVVEKNKLYIMSVHVAKRIGLANLKIPIDMLCEGKISIHDVFRNISTRQLIELLDEEVLLDSQDLELLAQGLPACNGVGIGVVCYDSFYAANYIDKKEEFIFCKEELAPHEIEIVSSKYCKGVMTARGGMTSHAAVICRGMGKPCVAGFGDFNRAKKRFDLYGNITVDGNSGSIYGGAGKTEKKNTNLEEVKMLYELLWRAIKYNIITSETAPLVWRLWNLVVINKRYIKSSKKRLVIKSDDEFVNPIHCEKKEIESIYNQLRYVKNGGVLVEDFISFLFDELSAQVPLGKHFLYMRPALNPLDTIKYNEKNLDTEYAGTQLTGIEFFDINSFLKFAPDINSIKIYFSTKFYKKDAIDENGEFYAPLNYPDYTNPQGESLIINTFDADKIAICINNVQIPAEQMAEVYHLFRRRKYCWANEERENLRYNPRIERILDEVILRGYDEKPSECNDFVELIRRKDFKDLIALELYEYYFCDERHEFDLQILKEIVESISDYFGNPDVIRSIEAGLLQTMPSTIIAFLSASVWKKLKIAIGSRKEKKEESSWQKIEKNIQKIDKEFANHDYILTEEIEHIFNVSREEIQPLLKLCGCKCYVHKKRSIWIKVGTKEERIKEILKMHHFK